MDCSLPLRFASGHASTRRRARNDRTHAVESSRQVRTILKPGAALSIPLRVGRATAVLPGVI
ncbi:hypothetical protein STSO111631_10935 [Stackebrandtia soli]